MQKAHILAQTSFLVEKSTVDEAFSYSRTREPSAVGDSGRAFRGLPRAHSIDGVCQVIWELVMLQPLSCGEFVQNVIGLAVNSRKVRVQKDVRALGRSGLTAHHHQLRSLEEVEIGGWPAYLTSVGEMEDVEVLPFGLTPIDGFCAIGGGGGAGFEGCCVGALKSSICCSSFFSFGCLSLFSS